MNDSTTGKGAGLDEGRFRRLTEIGRGLMSELEPEAVRRRLLEAEDEFGKDEVAASILAGWAGVAIENARLYSVAIERSSSLERAVARLEASSEIARVAGGETRLDRVLETVVSRARTLVKARAVVALLEDRGALVAAAASGEFAPHPRGVRLAADGSAWRTILTERNPERVDKVDGRLGLTLDELGINAEAALLVPLSFRNRAVGVLAAFDREGEDLASMRRTRLS